MWFVLVMMIGPLLLILASTIGPAWRIVGYAGVAWLFVSVPVIVLYTAARIIQRAQRDAGARR